MRNAKLVEQAACLCSAMAWSWSLYGAGIDVSAHNLANFESSIDSRHGAGRLAWEAFVACPPASFIERWALACSMLRNDEVES